MRCPNCGQERSGRFCAGCGQSDRDYRRRLPPLVVDLLRDAFDADGRLPRTLVSLVVRPGALSLEFSRDRRASYVNPARLYLFVSILFFFTLSVTTDVEIPTADVESIDDGVAATAEAAAALRGQLDLGRRAKLERILAEDSRPIARRVLIEIANDVSAPELALERFLDNLPLVMFLLLPGYAALLALLFRRKGRYYVEHLVCALHFHSFAFLLFTLLLLLPEGGGDAPWGAFVDALGSTLWLGLVVYQYLALKRYYGEGHAATAGKFAALLAVYGLLLAPGFLAVALVTLAFG